MANFTIENKLVFVTGGSKGLGKALAKLLASKGANVVILARTISTLEESKVEILGARRSQKQTVDTIAVDLTIAEKVEKLFDNYRDNLPDMLICTAGGTSSQLGFLADISATDVKACMEINYYSAAFITQSCLRRWLRSPSGSPRTIVLTSSAAAFVGLPGYGAYTPAKVAVRALADTLRQELLLYGGNNKYRVHCCFPGTFVSEGFLAEQATKPNLTKELEKTNRPISELEKTYGTAESIAQKLIQGLSEGQFFVTMDADTRLLLNNMRGSSPRDRPVTDYLLGWLMGLIWPLIRRQFDTTTREYGRQAGQQSHL